MTTATIGRTTYQITQHEVATASRQHGVANQFTVVGPKGATAMVIDYGTTCGLVVVGSKHVQRNIKRSDLAAFGVEC